MNKNKKTPKKDDIGVVHIEVDGKGSVNVTTNLTRPMEVIGVIETAKTIKMRQFYPMKIQVPTIIPDQARLPILPPNPISGKRR